MVSLTIQSAVTAQCQTNKTLRIVEFQIKWTNKQRVLVFASRGISHRDRHLMQDLRTLMPHSKPESKMERKDDLFVINEVSFKFINICNKSRQNKWICPNFSCSVCFVFYIIRGLCKCVCMESPSPIATNLWHGQCATLMSNELQKYILCLVFQMCEMKNCNKCILFEGRLKRDLYMWITNIPDGPSAKFLVENGIFFSFTNR